MRRAFLTYGIFLITMATVSGQANMKISGNTVLSTSGNVSLHLINTDLITEGKLKATDSRTLLTSNRETIELGGNGSLSFNQLALNATNGNFKLTGSIEIQDQLMLEMGSLNLAEFDLRLTSETSQIIGETNTNRIYSSSDGKIIKTVNLNSPQSENPGNLGLIISTADNLGITEIHRSHQSIDLPSGSSISKLYEIYPEREFSTSLTVGISFFDAESGSSTADLEEIWKQKQNGDWTNLRSTFNRNTSAQQNTVEVLDRNPSFVYTVGPEKNYEIDISSIPTAFTPDQDGVNDQFIIPFITEQFKGSVTILSRWGDIIYNSSDYYESPWDGSFNGKTMPVATYYYVVSFTEQDRKEIKGNISIIR